MSKTMISSFEQLENGTASDKVLEIKSIYKNGKTTVQPVKDPMSGWYKGVPRLSEDDKRKLKFWAEPDSKFVLKDGVILDLNNEEHRVIWEWLKYQPALAMSYEECQMRPGAEFYIHQRTREASKNVDRKRSKFKAVNYIMQDNPVNYPLRAKLLGVNMDGEDPIVIEEFLLDRAEESSSKIIKIYEDKFVSLRMLLLEALEKRKIIIDPSGAYRYGNIFLGMSEDSVIDWMNNPENRTTVRLIEEELHPEYRLEDPEPDEVDLASKSLLEEAAEQAQKVTETRAPKSRATVKKASARTTKK
jgi:hypothetical protein